jgi:hypothetical protein
MSQLIKIDASNQTSLEFLTLMINYFSNIIFHSITKHVKKFYY